MAHCAWCTAPIRLGIVTRGGGVFHVACWHRRQELLRTFAD
jgi:hypothetical protein